ncbi:MAG: hypothetical protein QG635_2428 [Bacteroidota bacterium]|nr:hypothetical protein [Bacteroidota bacterium]
MKNNELIFEYIEGNLGRSEESELFSRLASDESLREELRQMATLETSLKGSASAFHPGEELSKRVFSGLGYDFNAPKPSMPNPGLLKHIGSYLLSGIIGSILTISAIYFIFLKNTDTSEISNQIPFSNQIEIQAPPPEKIIIFENKSKNINHSSGIIYSPANKVHVDNVSESRQISEIIPEITSIDGQMSRFYLPGMTNRQLQNYNNLNEPVINQKKSEDGKEQNLFAVEFCRNSAWHIQEPTISPKESIFFNNLSLDFFYMISDWTSIGLDIRQETFFQKYSDGRDPESTLTYEQQPNMTSFCLAGRMNQKVIGDFSGLFQLSVGGSRVGFVGRAMAGLEYSFMPRISILGGIEYNSLIYKHLSNYFFSDKINFNYGIIIKF